MAIDSSVHCHTGNARVVGFFGLEPKSIGAAVDLVLDLNRLFPVGRHLSPRLSMDRRLDDLRACQCGPTGAPAKHHHTYFSYFCFCAPNPERLWRIMICCRVGAIGTAPMMGPGDAYRLRAADMLAKAEQNERICKDFENLAMAYLRLAEQADRNAKLGQPLAPDESEQTLQQQQLPQQQQPKMKPRIDG